MHSFWYKAPDADLLKHTSTRHYTRHLALWCGPTCQEPTDYRDVGTLAGMDEMMVAISDARKVRYVKNIPWWVHCKALISPDSKTDPAPMSWKGWVIHHVDQSFKDFLASKIPENTVSYKVTRVTVLITTLRKRRKGVRLPKLSPALCICFSNQILTLRVNYYAVFARLQTSRSDELTMSVPVITKLLRGYAVIWSSGGGRSNVSQSRGSLKFISLFQSIF